MKKLISMLLAVVMICSVMTVPAFATSDFVYGSSSSYGMEYGESGGMVGVIRKTDEFGKTIYVHGSPVNNKVFALVNAPAMDYTKTIGSVTFSNYIKHNEKTLNGRDENGNRVKLNVTQVYVGLNASMRSEVDRVEFMLAPNGVYNQMHGPLEGQGYGLTSDFVYVKTNTPAYTSDIGTPVYKFIDYFSVRPYTNLGRNYDGTWQKGLTWVFEEHTKETDGGSGWGYASDPNQYRKVYEIRVESPNGTEYYQVIVTAEKNFAGEKQEAPVEPPKVETPTVSYPAVADANPTTSPIYVNGVLTKFDAYNINGNNYFKLRDVALSVRGSQKQFEVIWNPSYTETVNGQSVRGCIEMISNKAYTTVGGEMALGDGIKKTANITTSPILKDGNKVTNLTGYNIKGNNYFKLRDLGILFDFDVTWDGARKAVVIDTTKSYTED